MVIVVTLGLFGGGIYGMTQLETDYNPVWYMRESSYQQHFYIALGHYFPESGERVQVYVGERGIFSVCNKSISCVD